MAQLRSPALKDQIECAIVSGSFKPGMRLDESSLASRFGVSRTPVREALRHLASAGLVEIRPRRGAIVAEIGLKDLVEMFEVMAELEGACGRFAARRITESEREALLAVHRSSAELVQQGNHDAYYERNVQFHEVIYRASHNGFLAEQTLALRNRLTPYRRLQLRRSNRLAESFSEHQTIADAIVDGDAERTETLLRRHVTAQSGHYSDFIVSLAHETSPHAS